MTLPPIPPSDNLYKFAAIGGLILVILSLYFFPWKMSLDLVFEFHDLEFELQKWKIESDRLNSELSKKTEDLRPLREKAAAEEPKPDTGRYDRDVQKKISEQLIILEELKTTRAKLEFVKSQIVGICVFSVGMAVIGFGITYRGFRDWYYRFQVYQDQIVKAQAEQWTKPQPETDRDEIPG